MENNNLVFDFEGTLVVSSRKVADDFGKRHADLLEKIDEKLENEKIRSLNYFIESSYTVDNNNKVYKEYLLSRDGFSFIVMGFTTSKADDWKIKYIEAFNSMEKQLKDIQTIQNSEYRKFISCVYGKVFNLSNCIDIINNSGCGCYIENEEELIGHFKSEKWLLDNNKITEKGYRERCLVLVENEIYASHKALKRVVQKCVNDKIKLLFDNSDCELLEDKQISFNMK